MFGSRKESGHAKVVEGQRNFLNNKFHNSDIQLARLYLWEEKRNHFYVNHNLDIFDTSQNYFLSYNETFKILFLNSEWFLISINMLSNMHLVVSY